MLAKISTEVNSSVNSWSVEDYIQLMKRFLMTLVFNASDKSGEKIRSIKNS